MRKKNVRNCIAVHLRVTAFMLPVMFAGAQTQPIKFTVRFLSYSCWLS